MKILHITYSPGGVTTYLKNLIFFSPEDIQHVTISPDVLLSNVYQIKHRHFSLFDIAEFFKILKWISRIKPDCIHLHSSKAGFYFRFLSFFYELKYSSHAFAFLNKESRFSNVYFIIESFLARFFSSVFYISNSSGDDLKAREVGFINTRILLNPFVVKSFSGNDPYKRWRNSIKSILIIGRLTYQKNQIEIVKHLRANPKLGIFKFVFIGFGDIGEKKKEVEFLKWSETLDNVECIPWVDEQQLAQYYQDSFALFSYSKFESFGYVLAEAMSYGLPVISSVVDGPTDYLKNDNNGIFLNEISELCEKLESLSKDYNLYKRISQNAVLSISDLFQEKKVMNRIKSIYL